MQGVKRIFTRLNIFNTRSTLSNASAMYMNCKQQVENKHWHTRGLIGTDFRSKQALLMVHIWMVHKRVLMDKEDGEATDECLFDELWEDTSARIKSHGINIISINKYLKEVQGYSFRCCLELDHAVAKASANAAALALHRKAIKNKEIPADTELGSGPDGELIPLTMEGVEEEVLDDIGGVLWRFIYNRQENFDEEHIMLMAKYVREEQKSLSQMSMEALNRGAVKWGPLPNWKRVSKRELAAKHATNANNNSNNRGTNSNISDSSSKNSNSSSDAAATSSSSAEEQIAEDDDSNELVDDVAEDEWREALTPDGKVYYWHVKTRETTWDKPKELQ